MSDDDRRAMGAGEFGEWFGGALEAGLPLWVLEASDPVLAEAGAFVGVAGILPAANEFGDEPELGYLLAGRFHGRGLATEAVTAILDDATRRLGQGRVAAIVDAANIASIRVLEKTGFRLEREDVGGDGNPYRRSVRPLAWSRPPADLPLPSDETRW